MSYDEFDDLLWEEDPYWGQNSFSVTDQMDTIKDEILAYVAAIDSNQIPDFNENHHRKIDVARKAIIKLIDDDPEMQNYYEENIMPLIFSEEMEERFPPISGKVGPHDYITMEEHFPTAHDYWFNQFAPAHSKR